SPRIGECRRAGSRYPCSFVDRLSGAKGQGRPDSRARSRLGGCAPGLIRGSFGAENLGYRRYAEWNMSSSDNGAKAPGEAGGAPAPGARQIAINAQYIKDMSFENPGAPASL